VGGIRLSVPGSSGRCDATPKDDGREEGEQRPPMGEKMKMWLA
jgi:hypothetical protein